MKSIVTLSLVASATAVAGALLLSPRAEDSRIDPLRSPPPESLRPNRKPYDDKEDFRQWVQQDPDAVISWLDDGSWWETEEVRLQLARRLAKRLADHGDEARLASWLSRREVATASYAHGAVKEAAAAIAARSIEKGLEFCSAIPRGSMSRDIALQETFRTWTRADWEKAYDWFESRPMQVVDASEETGPEETPSPFDAGDEDSALAGFILGVFDVSAETASENLPLIRDPGLRERVRKELLAMAGFGE